MNLSAIGIRKQILILIVIILVPVLSHFWYTGFLLRQQAVSYAELQVDQGIQLFVDRQERLIEETRQMLSVMSHLPGIQQLQGAQCSATLTSVHADRPNYSTMVVAAPDGTIECCSLPLSKVLDVTDRDWFQRSLNTREFVVGNFVISRSSGKASLPLAYPVSDNSGNLQYILGAALNLMVYDQLFQKIPMPEGAQQIITDRSGTILYSSATGDRIIGKPLSVIPGLTLTKDQQDGRLKQIPEHDDTIFWLHRITVAHENNDIFVFVGIPAETVFAQVDRTITAHMILLLVVFFLSGATAWHFGGRYIAVPLQALVQRTARVAAGDLASDDTTSSLSGEIGQLSTAFRDMTEQLAHRESDRLRVEQALRESEQRYRALFEQNPISLWEQDFSAVRKKLQLLKKNGVEDIHGYFEQHPEKVAQYLSLIKVIHVNQATIDLYGASSAEELFVSLDKIIPTRSHHHLVEELVAIAEGKTFTVEVENRTLAGKSFPVLVNSALPIGYEDSWRKVFVSIFDLSERYEMEKQQKALQQQLAVAQKLETVGTLAGGIAHDFNNILSPIIGYTELLLNTPSLDNQTRSHLRNVLKAGQRARDMVHQILAFSRQRESSRQNVDLGKLLREALDLLRSSIPATIEIRDEIEQGLPPVFADAGRIHQVIMNLCTNSYQAMRRSGGIITVGARRAEIIAGGQAVRQQPHLLFFVADTGQGIPPEIQERVFEPFFTTKPAGEGSGMGLSVVHGIIKDHEGEIKITSQPDHGARFTVYLPCSTAPETIARENTPTQPPRGCEHIMVVDDEEQLVSMIQTMLRELGYTVSTFTDPLESLAAFRDTPQSYDLLLTDQTMPSMTGIQLTREILAIRSNLPIILYTGYSETITPENATRKGVSTFLYKPVDTQQLAVAIRSLLDP